MVDIHSYMNFEELTFEELTEKGEDLSIVVNNALEAERFDHARKESEKLLEIWDYIRESRQELHF